MGLISRVSSRTYRDKSKMASTEDIQLSKSLISQIFGNQVAVVATTLLKHNHLTLKALHTTLCSKISASDLKSCVSILIQHDLVSFKSKLVPPKNHEVCLVQDLVVEYPIQYSANVYNILQIMNYPRIATDALNMSQ